MTANPSPILVTAPRPRSVSTHLRLLRRIASPCLAAWIVSSGGASAGTFGNFTYTDNGTTITISAYAVGAPAAVVIPDKIDGKDVVSIASNTFFNRSELTSVSIPSTVTTIGDQVFYLCSGLQTMTIPPGVTVIGNNLFTYCSGLQSITLEGPVTTIGNSAFFGCTSLQSIAIPSTVTSIGTRAFQSCTNLTSVALPPNLGSLKDYTFAGCTGLTSMTIPQSVTSIGKQAFINCTGLTSITIPSSVTTISDAAFANCSNLLAAIFTGNAPNPMGTGVFSGTPAGFKIYHTANATGFDVAPWTSYAIEITASDPLAAWLADKGLPADVNLLSDANGDGVCILMAYALNLNPNANLSASLPQPVFSATEMTLTYLEAAEDVTYVVETSTDARNWTTEGVTMSAPDPSHVRTATVPRTGPRRFMRLSVSR